MKVLSFAQNVIKTKLPNGIYRKGIYGEGSSASELLEDAIVSNGYFVSTVRIRAPFVWGQEFLNAEIKNGTEVLINTMNFQVRVIRHNNDSIKAFPSFIDGREDNATNEDAYELLKSMFNVDSPFKYSKPVNLIKKLLLANSYFDKSATILDFFAGSGTTLHATMQLNKEDGGHRQCILVTNNENKICEEVTYVRNKRVIQGYVTPKGEFVEGLKANTLRYYRTKLLPRVDTNQNRRALMAACTELLCIEQDLYEEQTSFAGRKLNPRKARYFAQGKRRMLVIYDEQTVDTFAELLREMEVEERIRIYLFSFNGYPHTDNFMEVLDKVELCALPQAIYNVYNRVLPKAVEPVNEEEERP